MMMMDDNNNDDGDDEYDVMNVVVVSVLLTVPTNSMCRSRATYTLHTRNERSRP